MNAGQSLNQLLIHGLSQIENVYTDGQKRDAIVIQGLLEKDDLNHKNVNQLQHAQQELSLKTRLSQLLKQLLYHPVLLNGILPRLNNQKEIYLMNKFRQNSLLLQAIL
jgi:hypothetical protein